jgi:hypothetical protein
MPGRRRDGPGDLLLSIGCSEAVPIGSGGSSVVYRARQQDFDRVVAVKILTLPLRTRKPAGSFSANWPWPVD